MYLIHSSSFPSNTILLLQVSRTLFILFNLKRVIAGSITLLLFIYYAAASTLLEVDLVATTGVPAKSKSVVSGLSAVPFK